MVQEKLIKEQGNKADEQLNPKGFMSFRVGDERVIEVLEANKVFKFQEGVHHESLKIWDGTTCSIIKEDGYAKWTPSLNTLNKFCEDLLRSGLKFAWVKRMNKGGLGNPAKIDYEVLDEEGFKKKTLEMFSKYNALKIGKKGTY